MNRGDMTDRAVFWTGMALVALVLIGLEFVR
jgi:hypothetical protein